MGGGVTMTDSGSNGYMKLYFENSFGKKKLLGQYETERDAVRDIIRFCEDHNFTVHYIRTTEAEEYKWYDVGSHSEFFYLYKNDIDPKGN